MTKRPVHSGTYTLGLVASISVATALSGASCSETAPSTSSTASSTSSGIGGEGGTTLSTSSSSSSGMGGKGGAAMSSSSGGMGGEGGSGGSTGSAGGTAGTGGTGGGPVGPCPCTDFPATPVLLDGLMDDVVTAFENADAGMPGFVCISEPANDGMVPRNWTPLLIDFSPKLGQNVYQIKVEVDNQVNPLVVYTTKYDYTMPAAMWTALNDHSAGHDVKITIRTIKWENGAITEGPYISDPTILHIAPIAAPGSVVYWAYKNNPAPTPPDTYFRGFTVGDRQTKIVLTPMGAGTNAGGKQTGCISCHASSPDGKIMFYSSDDPPGYHRSVDARLVTGGKPTSDMISDAAFSLLGRHRQLAPVLSPAHYSNNDAVVITSYVVDPMTNYQLIWTDLHAANTNKGTGWDVIARTGDTRNPTSATWSHDGKDIAYVSSQGGQQGVIATLGADQVMDIYVVPYNNRAGGTALPLPGASDPQKREFYPIYSPNDTFIAFNRSDMANTSYDQASAEIFVVPRAGGTARRLKANDPMVCTGLRSPNPGIANSWARWAPQAPQNDGIRYYWLVYSSKRRVAAALRPQLYIAAILTKVENGMETVMADYPGVYVGSQEANESNHTPVWDYFVVDQIPE